MQWEGQDLQTQLFSPNGPAQEVPVRNHLCPELLINHFKIFISLSSPCFLFSVGLGLFFKLLFSAFFPLQDLLTSALLSDDGHKTYHLSRRGMDSPLQVCFSWHSCACTSILHVIRLNVQLIILPSFLPGQQQLNSWEPEKCGKTEEHVFASEQSHKYLNTYSTRTLVM